MLLLLLTSGGGPEAGRHLDSRGDGLGDQQAFMIDAQHIWLACL